MTRFRPETLFAYVAVAWGGSYVAIKTGLASLPPVEFASIRLLVAAVCTLPVAVVVCEHWLPRTRADLRSIAVGGVFITGLANAFLFVGQGYATSAVAAILFSLNPVLATAFTQLALPEDRLTAVEGVGVILGLAGVGIVVDPNPNDLLAASHLGKYVVLLGATATAFGSVLSRRTPPDVDAFANTAWSLALGGVLLAIIGVPLEGVPASVVVTPTLLGVILYLGVVSTALAYPAFFALLDSIGPVRTNLVSYVVPIVAALTGWALLGEPITATTVVGFLVVVVGFALVNRTALAAYAA